MFEKLASDRRVQFAVGLALLLLAVKVMFTGSLLSSIEVMRGNVTEAVRADDGTMTRVTVPASQGMLEIAFDAIVTIVAGIGGYALTAIVLLFSRLQSMATPVETTISSSIEPPVSVDSDSGLRKAVIALGEAAATNDLEAMERLRVQIRKPFAMESLNEAYREGNTTAAAVLVAELNKMHEATPAAKKKGGQQSNG